MKLTALISITVVILALGAGVLFREGSESREQSAAWLTFDEGIRLADKENKKILIDVYTDWCGWCKKMESEVYADKEVRTVIDSRFVAIKLDAESSRRITFNGTEITEADFAKAAGVTGYPTTLFLDQKVRPITSFPGYVSAERFRSILGYVGEDHYTTISFEQYLTRSGPS